MEDDTPRHARTLCRYWGDIRRAHKRQRRAVIEGDDEAAGDYGADLARLRYDLSRLERIAFRRDENKKRRKGL